MNPPCIRRAEPADFARITEIELAAGPSLAAYVPAHILTEATPPEGWRPSCEAGWLYVLEDGGELIGFLAALPAGEDLHVAEFDVIPERQGRGHGRRLLTHVLDAAAVAGYRAATLTTQSDAPQNAPFYASLGFEIVDPAPPRLAAILAGEAQRGLLNRCAMRKPL